MPAAVSSVGTRLEAYVLAQIAAAEHLLRGKARHSAIHDARKAIRRARAALRLVRKPLGAAAAAAYEELGCIGESLSDVRDAHVAVRTLQSLAVSAQSADEQQCLRRTGKVLGQRRVTRLAALLAADPACAARRARLHRLHDSLAALDWNGISGHTLLHALARSVDRTGRIGHRAHAVRDAELRHLWRRRLRRLRYQLAAVEAALGRRPPAAGAWSWPGRRGRDAVELAVQPKPLRALTDRLGRERDLGMLHAVLLDADGITRADRALACRVARRAIVALASERQDELMP